MRHLYKIALPILVIAVLLVPGTGAAAVTPLPLATFVYDSTPPLSYKVPGDMGNGPLSSTSMLKYIPQANRAYITPTIINIDSQLNALPLPISYLVYDIENWSLTTAWEQQNPVAATQQAQAIAKAHGWKLYVVPTLGIAQKYGTGMVKYADVFTPQSKGVQAAVTPAQFAAQLNPLYDKLRAANPNVKIYGDVSVNPKGVSQTAQQMMGYVDAIRGHVDGISSYYARSNESIEAQFAKLLQP